MAYMLLLLPAHYREVSFLLRLAILWKILRNQTSKISPTLDIHDPDRALMHHATASSDVHPSFCTYVRYPITRDGSVFYNNEEIPSGDS
jgi:hypothetical protein